jgi:hypothetical protein
MSGKVENMKGEISPIDIIKTLPKNNCGECGLNTCMAFATAVTRRTIDYKKCPYIKLTPQLKKEIKDYFESEKKDRIPGMHALTNLESSIVKLDFQKVAKKLDLIYEKKDNTEMLKIYYIDTFIFLYRKDNTLTLKKDNNEDFDIYDKILIYNYIFFAGEKGIAGQWIAMENMPNSISKISALKKGAENPIKEYFKGKLNLLKERANKLGGKILDKNECVADICIVFYIFPKLPIRVNFYDELKDEGIDASVKFLYDKNVLDYLDLESLVFSSEKLAEKLME